MAWPVGLALVVWLLVAVTGSRLNTWRHTLVRPCHM